MLTKENLVPIKFKELDLAVNALKLLVLSDWKIIIDNELVPLIITINSKFQNFKWINWCIIKCLQKVRLFSNSYYHCFMNSPKKRIGTQNSMGPVGFEPLYHTGLFEYSNYKLKNQFFSSPSLIIKFKE